MNADTNAADGRNDYEQGDIVRFTYDGETTHGIVKRDYTYASHRNPTVALPAGTNANDYTYVNPENAELVGHTDDYDPRTPSWSDDGHTVEELLEDALDDEDDEDAPLAPYFCMACSEFHDHVAAVQASHSRTGTNGCPECLDADPLRRVVHEVGDDETVTGGYVAHHYMDHSGSISLEAARAVAEVQN